jgi:hypothetical protein
MSLATTSAAAAAAAAPLLRPRRFDVRTKPATPKAAGPAPRRKACRQRKDLVQLALINPEIAGSNEGAYENPGKEIGGPLLPHPIFARTVGVAVVYVLFIVVPC